MIESNKAMSMKATLWAFITSYKKPITNLWAAAPLKEKLSEFFQKLHNILASDATGTTLLKELSLTFKTYSPDFTAQAFGFINRNPYHAWQQFSKEFEVLVIRPLMAAMQEELCSGEAKLS